MIRYRSDPDNPLEPIIEATPRDIDQFRAALRASLHRAFPKFGLDGIEDVTQQVMIVAWRAVPAGRVRGRFAHAPESALRAWLIGTAWRIGKNAQRLARRSLIELGGDHDGPDPGSPADDVIEARGMLETIARREGKLGIYAILLLADGASQREVAREVGVSLRTLNTRVQEARTRLALMGELAPWREPAQPLKRSPRNRKRGQ